MTTLVWLAADDTAVAEHTLDGGASLAGAHQHDCVSSWAWGLLILSCLILSLYSWAGSVYCGLLRR